MSAAGKVITGYSLPYVALYAESSGTISYSSGQQLARGVDVSVEVETADDNNFYADNVLTETASGLFQSGTASLTVDGLLTASEKLIMGLPSAVSSWTAYDDTQSIPYVGLGFIVRYMSDSVTTYVPVMLPKCKFHQVSIEAATQEDEIDWQTTSLEADVLKADDTNGTWKYVGADCATEAAALALLKAKLGIS